jgi:hypothetical protein
MPKAWPPLWQASAALRNASNVQASAWRRAGGIHCLHVDAGQLFIRSMREHDPLIWLPTVAGTASHCRRHGPWPTVPFTAPFCLISGSMTSFIATS